MATKEEILQGIKELANSHNITKAEVLSVFNEASPQVTKNNVTITDILYYIGGAIVFLGISIFVYQNWGSLNSFLRIFSTLGSGIAAYFVALLFSRNEKIKNAAVAFHLISALVMPLGLFVTFHESGINVDTLGMRALIPGILLFVYASSLAIFKKDLFVVFSVIFGTWFFFGFTDFIISGSPVLGWHFFEYRVLAAGISYILLGNYFSKTERKELTGFLYGFGVLGFLAAALSLGGWKPSQNVFWELIYPGLLFVTLFLGVNLKSNSFLTFGTIFLMIYIIKITAEYFSGSMGWPLSLVVIGLLLIAAGYLFVYLRNKYIKVNNY